MSQRRKIAPGTKHSRSVLKVCGILFQNNLSNKSPFVAHSTNFSLVSSVSIQIAVNHDHRFLLSGGAHGLLLNNNVDTVFPRTILSALCREIEMEMNDLWIQTINKFSWFPDLTSGTLYSISTGKSKYLDNLSAATILIKARE